jgi:phasin
MSAASILDLFLAMKNVLRAPSIQHTNRYVHRYTESIIHRHSTGIKGGRVERSNQKPPFKRINVMTENIAAKKFGEKSAAHIKDASAKMNAAAEQTTKLIENTYATATKGIKDYNFKAIEFAQVNSDAAFDYAKQLISAKAPSEMLELWTTHARKQFEVLTEQTKELAILGQRVTTEAAEPLSSGVTKAFSQAA